MKKTFWTAVAIAVLPLLVITCTNLTNTNKDKQGDLEGFASHA
ncbi:MAG: hypothetical protein WKG06_45605 [Segetibacter sp.]